MRQVAGLPALLLCATEQAVVHSGLAIALRKCHTLILGSALPLVEAEPHVVGPCDIQRLRADLKRHGGVGARVHDNIIGRF